MTSFAERVATYIRAEGLLGASGAKVVVGLSGGADSVALLSVLSELGYACHAVHCHFGLRPTEADRDADHARRIAQRLGVDFQLVKFNTQEYMRAHGVSAEMACRELRYAEFERIRCLTGSEAIAVGHHREDNVETMLLNLLRGSGIHGVRGMLPRSGKVVRPLLDVAKEMLLEHLRQCGLDYVTDSSNLSCDFKRNKLRNQVIPVLIEAFPDAIARLTDSIECLRGCEQLYNSLLPDSLSAIRHSAAPATLAHELLSPYGFNSTQCRQMITASAGAEFSAGRYVVCVAPDLSLQLIDTEELAPEPQLTWRRVSKSEVKFAPNCLYLDAAALEGSPRWSIERWQPGERMTPYGMRGTRMISDILADLKVASTLRGRCRLLKRNGEVLWVIGLRSSAHFVLTPSTTDILEIKLTER